MHRVELWLWWITDARTGRRRRPRYRMTETEALALDPAATRIPLTLEVREVPDDGERTGAWLNKK